MATDSQILQAGSSLIDASMLCAKSLRSAVVAPGDEVIQMSEFFSVLRDRLQNEPPETDETIPTVLRQAIERALQR